MNDLRTAAQQALKVLEAGTDVDPIFAGETEVALRAALAQQVEPAQKQDAELSAALGWPGGISNPVLDRKVLLQKVAALRLASQQALEALRAMNPYPASKEDQRASALAALLAALAQQAEPVLVQGELPPRYVARSPIQAEPVEPVTTLTAQRDALLGALNDIANTDPVDAALDPQRAVRIARAAIKAVEEGK